MKTTLTLAGTAAAAVAVTILLVGQSPAQSGSNPAHSRSTGEAGKMTGDGLVVREGVVFLVREGMARRVDAALAPADQMLTREGQLAPIPENVTGLGATGTARVVAGASTTAKPNRPDDATTQDGLVLQGGTVYLVREGRAQPANETTVPSGQMLMWDGTLTKAPDGIQGLNVSTPPDSPAKDPASPGKPGAQKRR